MAHDVFISHSSKDKAIADAVCATLERNRIRCWIAPRDIQPGQEYARAIVDAIHGARVFILVFSGASNASEHVIREVNRAITAGLPVLPLRVEDVMPTHSLDYYLAGKHWLDALTPPLEEHLARLSEAVSLLLAPPEAEARPQPAETPPANNALDKAKEDLNAALAALNQPGRPPMMVPGVEWLNSCAFSSDGQRIVSGGLVSLKLSDALTLSALLVIPEPGGGVSTCAISPDSRSLASARFDSTIKLWDAQTGTGGTILRGTAKWSGPASSPPMGGVLSLRAKTLPFGSGTYRQATVRQSSRATAVSSKTAPSPPTGVGLSRRAWTTPFGSGTYRQVPVRQSLRVARAAQLMPVSSPLMGGKSSRLPGLNSHIGIRRRAPVRQLWSWST